MKRKIYGVPGQLECKLIINCGQFRAEVHFKGGSIMDKTRRPATYATSRFLEQDIIENSAEFRSGKIVLFHEMEVPDDAEEQARIADIARLAKAKHSNGGTLNGRTAPEPIVEPNNEDSGNAVTSEGERQTINVACKADAVEWLKERFPEKGYNGATLRGKEAFEAACAEAGVEFVIGE